MLTGDTAWSEQPANTGAEQKQRQFRLYSGMVVQRHSGGLTPSGHLVARFRLTEQWFVDVVGTSGAVLDNFDGGDQFFLGLAAGPGFSTGEKPAGWELRISPRLTHIHHASFRSWGDTPAANLAGDSNGGLQHRTGAQLAVGLAGPDINLMIWDLAVLWDVEILADVLPNSPEMGLGAGFGFNFSLRRRAP